MKRLFGWISQAAASVRRIVEIDGDTHERTKILLLATAFFLLIGSYTVARELKDSIFTSVVGLAYVPKAKQLAMLVLIPAILFYARLVDKLRKQQLLYLFTGLYAAGLLISAYLVGHPVIGLSNTVASVDRLFGWFFYFFIEGFSPFVVSVFWAYTNSVCGPDEAKKHYMYLIAGSKLGGVLMALLVWFFLGCIVGGSLVCSSTLTHQLLLLFSAVILLCVPLVVRLIIRRVPQSYLHGYEAAYRVDVKQAHHAQKGFWEKTKSAFSGITLFVQYPYVLGIFSMVFFWEVVNAVFSFLRLGIFQEAAAGNHVEYTRLLLGQAIWSHLAGLVIVLLGSRTILEFLGVRKSLMAVPIGMGILTLYFMMTQNKYAAVVTLVIMRAINYAFAQPLRETLYIPTTKEVKFKSKSWIDAFGAKFAKAIGSEYNELLKTLVCSGSTVTALFQVNVGFFVMVYSCWASAAYLLGRRYERSVARNEVIGL